MSDYKWTYLPAGAIKVRRMGDNDEICWTYHQELLDYVKKALEAKALPGYENYDPKLVGGGYPF
jgi:hypothetical protein